MKNKNKLIIISIFVLIIGLIYFYFTRNKNNTPISENEAHKIISDIFGEEIEEVKGNSLILTDNAKYSVLVVKDQYLLIDKSTNTPKIFQFTSTKGNIKVKVLEIYDEGYLVEHDDHTHIVNMEVDKNIKVGDIIEIKDPHTYID